MCSRSLCVRQSVVMFLLSSLLLLLLLLQYPVPKYKNLRLFFVVVIAVCYRCRASRSYDRSVWYCMQPLFGLLFWFVRLGLLLAEKRLCPSVCRLSQTPMLSTKIKKEKKVVALVQCQRLVGLAAELGGGIFGIQGSIRAGTLVGGPVLCNSARIRARSGMESSISIPWNSRLACLADPCLPQLALNTQRQGTRGPVAHVHPVQS